MSRVGKAENGMRHTVWFAYPLLRILGAWPNRVSSSTLSKIFNWYLIFTCYTLQLIVLVPGFLHVFLKEKNGRKKMKMMIPQVNGYLQLCKYSLVLRWTNKLRVLLDEMKEDWLNTTEEDQLIFRAKASFGHRVMSMIAIVTYSAGLGYRTILPLSKGRILLPNNTTKRLLPCPGYFVFFNEQVSPIYEIIFIIQVLGGLLTYTIICGTIGMCVMFCLHSSSLLRILLNKICQLTKQLDMNEVVVHEKIVEIVKYQTRVKEFLNNVEQLTTHLFFLEIMIETSIGCIIGYNVVKEWEDNNAAAMIIHLMMQACIMSCTFIMCYVGQILIDEGNNVRRMSITLDWYRFPVKEARNLILVIIMSSYPVKLTAGKVVDISLATFTDIIKTTVGYLNMLQKVT